MPKVIRKITYEGSADWIKSTLFKSLADGVMHAGRNTITVETLETEVGPIELDSLARIYKEHFSHIDEKLT